jgi:hypothetical protein
MASVEAVTKYFEVWNTHSGADVGNCFAADGTLEAFDVEGTVTGSEACGEG